MQPGWHFVTATCFLLPRVTLLRRSLVSLSRLPLMFLKVGASACVMGLFSCSACVCVHKSVIVYTQIWTWLIMCVHAWMCIYLVCARTPHASVCLCLCVGFSLYWDWQRGEDWHLIASSWQYSKACTLQSRAEGHASKFSVVNVFACCYGMCVSLYSTVVNICILLPHVCWLPCPGTIACWAINQVCWVEWNGRTWVWLSLMLWMWGNMRTLSFLLTPFKEPRWTPKPKTWVKGHHC